MIFMRQIVQPVLLVCFLGFLYGSLAAIGLSIAKKILMSVLKPDLEPLTTIDEFFLLDWD